jgi:hypothetical protein
MRTGLEAGAGRVVVRRLRRGPALKLTINGPLEFRGESRECLPLPAGTGKAINAFDTPVPCLQIPRGHRTLPSRREEAVQGRRRYARTRRRSSIPTPTRSGAAGNVACTCDVLRRRLGSQTR